MNADERGLKADQDLQKSAREGFYPVMKRQGTTENTEAVVSPIISKASKRL